MKWTVLLLLAACGNAEIVAPDALLVLDTHPGNGSVVAAGDRPIAVVFSEDVIVELLEASVLLEETTPQGTPLRELAVSLDVYDRETFTAVFSTEPFPTETTYQLTVKRDPLRAAGGAKLKDDLTRRFQAR